jgi:hypothetical protein
MNENLKCAEICPDKKGDRQLFQKACKKGDRQLFQKAKK